MRSQHILFAIAFLLSVPFQTACSGGSSTPAPVSTATAPPTSVAAPPPSAAPGQVLVTVAAASTPPGATVTGGGQVLGTTPFTSQVPVPAPNPGDPPQTFQFTFTLPGFQATTITASPVNNTISLNAVLASAMAAPPSTVTGVGLPPATTGGSMRVHGVGGGPIFDYHTTTSVATVPSPCVVRTLRVDLSGNHTFNRDLEVSLRAPDGQSFPLQRHSSRSPFRTHTVTRARGHLAMGVWTLSVEDTVGADRGMLTSFDMMIDCM